MLQPKFQSLEIAKTVYQTNWYTLDAGTQKMLLLIMLRSQRAVTVKAPFFSPSLPAFQAVRYNVNRKSYNIKLYFSDTQFHWILYSSSKVLLLNISQMHLPTQVIKNFCGFTYINN